MSFLYRGHFYTKKQRTIYNQRTQINLWIKVRQLCQCSWMNSHGNVSSELMDVSLHSSKEQGGAQTYVSLTIKIPFLATS